MLFILPEAVKKCINTIENHGFEAWCVGGAVRDHVMGVTPGDYDVTTNALPEDIIGVFEKTVPTGIKHGTVTVIIDGLPIEVTTYRTDGGYQDHRKPTEVIFVNSIENDLLRRDFTMNAVCYNPKTGIFDPLMGVVDINNKTIRAVGDPLKRFEEDALRIMRAFRFSCQLGFDIEPNTLNAALSKAKNLQIISAERIAVELKKSIISNEPWKIAPLILNGGLLHIGISNCTIPECLSSYPTDFALRFAYICYTNSIDGEAVLTNLKLDNKTKKSYSIYLKLFEMQCLTSTDIRRMLSVGGIEHTKNILLTKSPEALSVLDVILKNNEPYCISMLKISGEEIKNLGLKSESIGNALSFLLDKVIETPELNTKDDLLMLVNEFNAD